MAKKTIKIQSGKGPTILEKIKVCLTPEEYEFITQKGNFDKLLKARTSFEVPKGRQVDRYKAKCRVQKIANKLEQEDPNITISEVMMHPEIQSIYKEEGLYSDSGLRAWIRPALKKRKSGRPKKK